jgi:O-antigen/teichoic acid export membrane protein
MKEPPSPVLFAVAPLASAALAFVMVPLMTWTMPVTTITSFGLFQYASAVLLIIVTLGLDQAFLRAISGSQAPSVLLRTCLIPSIAMMFLVGIITWAISGTSRAANIFGKDSEWVLPMLCINVFLLMMHRFGAQQTRMDQKGGAPYLLAELLLRIPLLTLLCFLALQQVVAPPQWLYLAMIFGAALAATVHIVFNQKTWIGMSITKPTGGEQSTTQLLAFGAPLAVAGSVYWAMANIGVYLTQWLHGPAVAAQLVVAVSIANVATIGQAMFSVLWLPLIYRRMDAELTADFIGDTAERVCVGAAYFYGGTFALVHGVQYLLGPSFRDVGSLVAAVCVLPVLYTVSEVTFIGLMVKRNSGLALLATCFGLVTAIAANAILTSDLGAAGAASAVSISALAFFFARSELAIRAWQPIARFRVYFGAASIAAAGAAAPLLPQPASLATLLLLMPYLWFERRMAFTLIRILADTVRRKILLRR